MVWAAHDQRLMDCFGNRVRLAQHIVIPETKGEVAAFLQEGVARGIGGRVRMLSAIHFHDQFSLKADEIEDAMVIGDAAGETAAVELAAAKDVPEALFGVGHGVAQAALQAGLEDAVVRLAAHLVGSVVDIIR